MTFAHGPLRPLPKQNAAPSNLAAVIRQAVAAFDAMGNGTPVDVGDWFVGEFGTGSDARVVFAPEMGAGKIGPPHEMGNVASMTHSCDVYVRAAETQDPLTRFDAAYDLADIVIECIQTAGTGRISWGAMSNHSPVKVPSGMGAGLTFAFTFTRDIRHAKRARVAAAPTSNAPVSLQPPDNREGLGAEPGEHLYVDELTPTVTPVEE